MTKSIFRLLIVLACAIDVVVPVVVAHFVPSLLLFAGIFTSFVTTIGIGVASFYVKK